MPVFCHKICEGDSSSLGMNIGYARVSSSDQHLDLQLDALHKAGCRRVFQEKVSGAWAGGTRPELARLLEQLQEEDVVVD